jgi:hypothetical protein
MRIVVLENERVANPDFYPMLQELGGHWPGQKDTVTT